MSKEPTIVELKDEGDDFLGMLTALQKIQAIQQEYIREQVEKFGLPRDPMDEGKAYLEREGE